MSWSLNAAVLLLVKNCEVSRLSLGISEETHLANTEFLLSLPSKQAKPPLLQAQLQKLQILHKLLSKALSHLAEHRGNSLCVEDIVALWTAQGERSSIVTAPTREWDSQCFLSLEKVERPSQLHNFASLTITKQASKTFVSWPRTLDNIKIF